MWQREHTGWNNCGTKSPSYDAHWFAAAAGVAGGAGCAGVAAGDGAGVVGAGFSTGLGVVSLALAAAAGGEPEPLAVLLVGTEEPLPVLLGVELAELAELLLRGAACEDEFPSVDPDF